jgi:hypothetical protein
MDNSTNVNENIPDIGDLISKLTSDPSMMRQISQIAESFKGVTETQTHGDEIPVKTVDNHTHLFNALKPYLNAERRAILEYITQFLEIMRLLELSGVNLGSLIPILTNNKISEE